jgi:hypothetical protein
MACAFLVKTLNLREDDMRGITVARDDFTSHTHRFTSQIHY